MRACILLPLVILVCSCTPIIDLTAGTEPDTAILISDVPRADYFMASIDRAYIQRVDSYPIERTTVQRRIRVPAGYLLLEVKYEKEYWAPSILGSSPFRFHQSKIVYELQAQSGHVYTTLADDKCDNIWIWIEDWGVYKEKEPSIVGLQLGYNIEYPVVAGERPDGISCSQERK